MLLLGGDVDKHQGLAVPSEAVLEEVCQLGVPEKIHNYDRDATN